MFIKTKTGYLNTSVIKEIREISRKKADKHFQQTLLETNENVIEADFGFECDFCLVQIIPAIGFELIAYREDKEEAEGYYIYAEDIIAWGLTLTGDIVPVCIEGTKENLAYAIKNVAKSTYEIPYIASFPDEAGFKEYLSNEFAKKPDAEK